MKELTSLTLARAITMLTNKKDVERESALEDAVLVYIDLEIKTSGSVFF